MSEVEISEKVKGLVEQISHLTLLEASELAEGLKEKFNIPDFSAISMAPAGAQGGGAGAVEAKEEKTAFSVVLKSFGEQKTKVIKVVKDLKREFGQEIGLKEVKDLVESAPVNLFDDVPKDKAEDFAKKLKEVGAEVSVE